ncbi:MAG TPA: DUF1772 domain-containing protein [Rhodospirillaceae bacterium]|nr:hypothetical protein [Rhodospirillaceae bacterium]HAT34441.1 DUF1772 domain-containing protein [Rhodospirillaceae bacterium]|tara:strand:- start:458 stop:952 length:495 start_codon:yes stop_codon:yes gene_type:complete
MDLIQIALVLSALLCALVAGLVFTFAIVAMPGIRTLGDLDYLKSFKAMDRVIQNNQPIFMLVWIGSVLVLLGSTALGFRHLEGLDLVLLIVACAIYILGVHVPTVAINIPLNNDLQSKNLDAMSEAEVQAVAEMFETRWMRWNTIRTVVAMVTTVLLLVLLIRL